MSTGEYKLIPQDGRGRTCLITGANRGLGLAVATELARRGAHVVLLCRNASSGQRAKQRVLQDVPGATVASLEADLSRQQSIREAVGEFREQCPALHVVIHNAAVVPHVRRITADGVEEQFAVNHLAPFLLTHLLLEQLMSSKPARIVVVASQMEKDGKMRFDDLTSRESYDPVSAYSQSKLANVLFTYKLAEVLRGTGVTANCLHPGVIDTRLLEMLHLSDRAQELKLASRHIPWIRVMQRGRAALGKALRATGAQKSPANAKEGPMRAEAAAAAVVRLALDPGLEAVSGRFFNGEVEGMSSETSRDTVLRERLWCTSASLVGLQNPDAFGQAV